MVGASLPNQNWRKAREKRYREQRPAAGCGNDLSLLLEIGTPHRDAFAFYKTELRGSLRASVAILLFGKVCCAIYAKVRLLDGQKIVGLLCHEALFEQGLALRRDSQ